MTLHPLRFLWRQLNGPIATAIMTALFRSVQAKVNPIVSYLSTFSIETATDAHLTFIGALLGLVRPVVSFADEATFFFTAQPEHGVEYGYSAAAGPGQIGGHFTGGDVPTGRERMLCPESYYRVILQGYLDSDADFTSLAFIDDILYMAWTLLRTDDPAYSIEFQQTAGASGGYGDIRVNLGPLSGWGARKEAIAWQSVLTSIFNDLLNPNIYISFEFTGD